MHSFFLLEKRLKKRKIKIKGKRKRKKKRKHYIEMLLKHVRTWVVVVSSGICDNPVILPL